MTQSQDVIGGRRRGVTIQSNAVGGNAPPRSREAGRPELLLHLPQVLHLWHYAKRKTTNSRDGSATRRTARPKTARRVLRGRHRPAAQNGRELHAGSLTLRISTMSNESVGAPDRERHGLRYSAETDNSAERLRRFACRLQTRGVPLDDVDVSLDGALPTVRATIGSYGTTLSGDVLDDVREFDLGVVKFGTGTLLVTAPEGGER